MTTAAVRRAQSPWLPFSGGQDGTRLYCLTHAGGSASAYRSWVGRLGSAAVCPVQLPGRETRLGQPTHADMAALVGELADVLLADLAGGGGRFAVYGHSFGALVGFELLNELARRGERAPEHLLVSGCPAPQSCEDGDRPVADMTDAEIVAMLRGLGGTPESFLRDPTVLRMILPPFRADFAVRDGYRYHQRPPLTVPVTAIAAAADPRVDTASMAGWREVTTGRFRAHTVPGGHFAVLENSATTLALISSALGG